MKTFKKIAFLAAFALVATFSNKTEASPLLLPPPPCVNGQTTLEYIVPQAVFPYFTIITVTVSC